MREIKFRAWDKRFNQMYPDVQGAYNWATYLYSGGYELMQYTGLKDKNGKEIYEGDIIEAFGGDYRAEIIWYEDEWKAVGWALKLKDSMYSIQSHFLPFYEVIGNIYENPELLKE